jgi:nuclear pore complex protein Nup205
MNAEAEAVRPFSNPVSEPSSGSSPVSGGVRLGQQDEIKVASSPSNSEVKGKKTLEGPSVVMEDAEWDQINAAPYVPDRNTASTFNVAAQSSEAGLLSRRLPVPDREERLSFLTGSRNFEEKSAQEGIIPGRSSRKRTHDARTRDSQYSAAQNSEPAFAVPQNRDVEGESRATPRPQSWLQRWMPKPSGATGFKTPQYAGSTPSKNRRLSLDSDSVGGEQEPSPSRAGSHRDDQYHQNANPPFAGEYPVPSAAAMAIVGAANRRSVPLPPQRVGTRIAVWPATAGMLMRRAAESESPEVLTAQVDVEVVVEARHE